jgi:hypothetical protein
MVEVCKGLGREAEARRWGSNVNLRMCLRLTRTGVPVNFHLFHSSSLHFTSTSTSTSLPSPHFASTSVHRSTLMRRRHSYNLVFLDDEWIPSVHSLTRPPHAGRVSSLHVNPQSARRQVLTARMARTRYIRFPTVPDFACSNAPCLQHAGPGLGSMSTCLHRV